MLLILKQNQLCTHKNIQHVKIQEILSKQLLLPIRINCSLIKDTI